MSTSTLMHLVAWWWMTGAETGHEVGHAGRNSFVPCASQWVAARKCPSHLSLQSGLAHWGNVEKKRMFPSIWRHEPSWADDLNENPKSKPWWFWMLVDFWWCLLTWFGKQGRKDSLVETQLRALKLLTLQPVCHGCRKRCFCFYVFLRYFYLWQAQPFAEDRGTGTWPRWKFNKQTSKHLSYQWHWRRMNLLYKGSVSALWRQCKFNLLRQIRSWPVKLSEPHHVFILFYVLIYSMPNSDHVMCKYVTPKTSLVGCCGFTP